jgi:hypothetical protein
MSIMEVTGCKDCKFYLSLDVFKGICKIGKQRIGPDDPTCEKVDKQAKCKYCVHFTPEKDFLGKCMKTALAYPDMTASQCTDFQWSHQN